MKRSFTSMLGVTLLEIMLVLAVAALMIVLGTRFYQSASTTNKVNAAMGIVQGIVSASESVINVKGNLSTVQTDITAYLPGNAMPNSPWGGAITISDAKDNSYTINIPVTDPTGCTTLRSLLNQNSKFKAADCKGDSIAVTVTS